MRRRHSVLITLTLIALVGLPLVGSQGAKAQIAKAQDPGWRPVSGEQARYGSQSNVRTADLGTALGNGNAIGSSSSAITPIRSQAPTGQQNGVPGSSAGLAPINNGTQRARVTDKSATLPNTAGQIFREYDIRPYTLRTQGVERPEQIIVDWILRETGYEAWHSEPIGLLSAKRESISIYHTPAMHALCEEIINRFVSTRADQTMFTLRIATIKSPNWRSRALPLMTPIPVQSPGVQGWLLSKEDAALLSSEIVRRTDFREYSSSGQLIRNGQTIVISTMRPRPYIKGIIPTGQVWPGYQPEMGQLEEGFALEFSPLLSLDGVSADAVIKLRLAQVEKMVPVKLNTPSSAAPNQRVQVEVPQMTTANLHERFRWPTDKVLLLSMGVVATPDAGGGNAFTNAIPMLKSPPRADALLMVECKPSLIPATASAPAARTAVRPQQSFLGRY